MTDTVFDGLDTKVEIVPAGQAMAEGRGKATHTAHYDVICPECGPLQGGTFVLYPTACAVRGDHLCNPNRNRRSKRKNPMAAAAARDSA